MVLPVIIAVFIAYIVWLLVEKKREEKRIKREDERDARRIRKEEEIRQQEKKEQEKNKKSEELEKWIFNHYETLINTVFNDWYNQHKPLNLTDEQIEERTRNRNNAIEHLHKKYPDVWKIWFEEREIIRKQIVEDTKRIREYVRNKSNDGSQLYLALNDIFDDDDYLVKIDDGDYGEVRIRKGTEFIFLKIDNFTTNGVLPRSKGIDEPQEAIEIKEIIEGIIKDNPLLEMINSLNENKKVLNKKIAIFNQKLKDIVDKYRNGMSPFDNTCNECQYRKNMLEALR